MTWTNINISCCNEDYQSCSRILSRHLRSISHSSPWTTSTHSHTCTHTKTKLQHLHLWGWNPVEETQLQDVNRLSDISCLWQAASRIRLGGVGPWSREISDETVARQIQHFAPFRSSRLTCWWTAGSTWWRNATANSTRCTKWWESEMLHPLCFQPLRNFSSGICSNTVIEIESNRLSFHWMLMRHF